MDQSNNPPIPASSSYSLGGSGAFYSFLAALGASFLASWTGAWAATVRASSSGILNLNK